MAGTTTEYNDVVTRAHDIIAAARVIAAVAAAD